jgi:hypothetical protein
MSIKEGEEVQAKLICNILNKIIAEKFPNLKKQLYIQVHDTTRISDRTGQNRTSPWHVIVKTTSTENRERILKAVREKKSNNIKR